MAVTQRNHTRPETTIKQLIAVPSLKQQAVRDGDYVISSIVPGSRSKSIGPFFVFVLNHMKGGGVP